MDYTAYLPDIDFEDGKARVMNNLKLYLRLLGRFDGAKMAGDVTSAIEEGNNPAIIQAAHAIRGTAANLGFPVVQQIAEEIEVLAKAGQDCSHLANPLNKAISALAGSIGNILAVAKI